MAEPTQNKLLELPDLTAGHGVTSVLERLSFGLDAGESMSVIGRNVVGKTTLINTDVWPGTM